MRLFACLLAAATLLSACSWVHHDDSARGGGLTNPDLNPSRGTTGVGSGADASRGVTGSDAAPQ